MKPNSARQKLAIGISSCLLGQKVRYDGGDQYHGAIIEHLTDEFELVAFCPEMDIGLGVPRAKIQLVEIADQIVCLDQPSYQIDYTQALIDSCDRQVTWLKRLSGYIFKTKSPSCGLTQVKTDHQGEIRADGQGIFACRLIERFANLPVIEEVDFELIEKRQQFVDAVREYGARIS